MSRFILDFVCLTRNIVITSLAGNRLEFPSKSRAFHRASAFPSVL